MVYEELDINVRMYLFLNFALIIFDKNEFPKTLHHFL